MGAYFGSKATSRLCQAIIALMPPHNTYVESHFGRGAITQRKLPAARNIGIDLNERTLSIIQCPYPAELVHAHAHRFVAEFPYQGREPVYCDPPYLHTTCSSDRRYRFEYDEPDHLELMGLLTNLSLEDACRHLVKQRMEVNGARWSLQGAEAILRLRELRMNQHLYDYFTFHRR